MQNSEISEWKKEKKKPKLNNSEILCLKHFLGYVTRFFYFDFLRKVSYAVTIWLNSVLWHRNPWLGFLIWEFQIPSLTSPKYFRALLTSWIRNGRSEMIVKIVGRIIFVKMAVSVVVAFLSQIRNIAEYKLKSEVKLKTN